MKTRFKFKRNAASYKNKKGDKTTISNSTMTDEKAIAFLKTNPERISLFLVFPKDWKKLTSETAKEKEARIAAEAEIEAANKAKKEKKEAPEVPEMPEVPETPETPEVKPERQALLDMGLRKLRDKYPDIKAASTEDFVNKILAE